MNAGVKFALAPIDLVTADVILYPSTWGFGTPVFIPWPESMKAE